MKVKHWVEVCVERDKIEVYERIGHEALEELLDALARLGLQSNDVRSTPCG